MIESCTHVDTVDDEIEPASWGGANWWWCYVDELRFKLDGAPPAPSHP